MATKKHIPRKNTDTNILRCILLNINEHRDTTFEDYKIEKKRYEILMSALLDNGIIRNIDPQCYSTLAFVISDIEKYHAWSKSNFYRAIENYVIPLIPILPKG